MIKAIVFDCFGVLVTEYWFTFKRDYFGHDKALADKAAELMDHANAGLLSYGQFVDELAEMAKVTPAKVREYLGGNAPDEELLEYITKVLKPNYKIGMLSNASSNWLKKMLSEDQLELFDAISLSYETGMAKPDERAYQLIADKLGVEPEECVFIDDQERYATAAEEAGMQAITYLSFDQMEKELTRVLQ